MSEQPLVQGLADYFCSGPWAIWPTPALLLWVIMQRHGNIGTFFPVASSVDDMPLFAYVYCDLMMGKCLQSRPD